MHLQTTALLDAEVNGRPFEARGNRDLTMAPHGVFPASGEDAWVARNGNQPHPATFCVHSQAYSKTPYCCDFAFVSEDLVPRIRRVAIDGETQASDHQPLLLEIDDR